MHTRRDATKRPQAGARRRAWAALALCAILTAWTSAGAAPSAKRPAAKTIAMIGAGHMGQALGDLWAAAGYRVIFASRHPDELDAVVRAAGHGARAAGVGPAVEHADIVVLAVPYRAEPKLAERYGPRMRGKVLVDVDNAFGGRDGAVARKAEAVGEAVYSARLFAGTRFIRAFNLTGANRYPEPGARASADFVVPYTTSAESLRPIAEALIRATGATPRYDGGLAKAKEY